MMPRNILLGHQTIHDVLKINNEMLMFHCGYSLSYCSYSVFFEFPKCKTSPCGLIIIQHC